MHIYVYTYMHIRSCIIAVVGVQCKPVIKAVYLFRLLNFLLLIGFKVLRLHYSSLVRSMPDDYMNTISKLEFHLSGDHIGSILECRDVFTANQRILDCLIEQICTEQELLNFCDWFSRIMNAPLLTTTVDNMKNGTYTYIYYYAAHMSKCSNISMH